MSFLYYRACLKICRGTNGAYARFGISPRRHASWREPSARVAICRSTVPCEESLVVWCFTWHSDFSEKEPCTVDVGLRRAFTSETLSRLALGNKRFCGKCTCNQGVRVVKAWHWRLVSGDSFVLHFGLWVDGRMDGWTHLSPVVLSWWVFLDFFPVYEMLHSENPCSRRD